MAIRLFDFNSYATGSFASVAGEDFTVQATPGGDWSNDIVDLGGGDHAVRVTRTTGASGITALVAHDYANGGDIEVYSEFALGTTWASNAFAGGALINTADNRAYAIRFSTDPTTDNFRLGLVNAAGSNNTSLGSFVPKTNPAAGIVIATRVGRYNSATTPALRGKLWLPASEAEPSWMWDAENSTLSTLRPGMYAFNSSDNPFTFLKLGIGTSGDTAPGANPFGNALLAMLSGSESMSGGMTGGMR